jgi:glycosyltransferase involved in cell wall biosynthesis
VRIAIIAPPWLSVPPKAYGGTESVLDILARGLDAAGHQVLLFATGDSTCPVPRSWEFDTAVGIAGFGPAAELRHAIAGHAAAANFGEVIHDHTLSGPVYSLSRKGPPVVTTNHGPFLSDLGPLYRAVSHQVPVIAISHHQAASALGVNLAGVIHHGLEPASVPVGTGQGGYCLFLGRMSPTKGVHVAARVARSAGVPLRIAAKMVEPSEKEYFEAVIRPLLGSGVEYVGEVAGPAKLNLLGDAACLLNPINWPEPFGMVMIEAMATGTPVIATPLGAAPEIVEEAVTGFLRPDEPGLVRALTEIESLDRRACRARVENHFSAERMVAEHLRVYESLACSDRPGL